MKKIHLLTLLSLLLVFGCAKDEPKKEPLTSLYETSWAGNFESSTGESVELVVFFSGTKTGEYLAGGKEFAFGYQKEDKKLFISEYGFLPEGIIGVMEGTWVINEMTTKTLTLTKYSIKEDEQIKLKRDKF